MIQNNLTSFRQILLLCFSVKHILSNETNLRRMEDSERELQTCKTLVSSANSNCFQDQKLTGGMGCDDAQCEAAVCSCDPYCCSLLWDSSCSSNLNFFTPGCSAGQLCCVEGNGPTFSFGNPTVFGSGCASGSYKIRDGSNPFVKLSSYTASTMSGASFDRKACSYAVPVTVNPGYYVQISGFSYDGSTTASVRAPTKFNAEHFFASSQGTKLDQAYTTSGDINIKYKGTVNSPCGGSFIFRINTGISAQGSNSMINVDKAFSYNVQSFPC